VLTRDQIATAVRAAQSGDERAFAELVARFQDIAVAYAASILEHFRIERALTWDRPPLSEQVSRLRGGVRERLANADRPVSDADTLDVEDARHLIARSEGFADWPALVASAN
jgi:hypothetical protein